MVLLPHPRHARLDHGAVSPLRKLHSHLSSSTRTWTHPAIGSRRRLLVPFWRPRSLEPATVMSLADIVSRVCSRVCCGAGVLAELRNAHLETLGHQYRFSARQSQNSCDHLGTPSRNRRASSGKSGPQQRRRHLENCANIRSIGL